MADTTLTPSGYLASPADHFAARIEEALALPEPVRTSFLRLLVVDAYYAGASHGLDNAHRAARAA